MKRGRAPECLGDLRFDQWLAGEVAAEEAQKLRQHLTDCLRCRERRALHNQARERYEATLAPAPAWLASAAETKPRRRFFLRGSFWRRLALVPALSVCVAAGVWLALHLQDPFVFRLPSFGVASWYARGLPFISFYVQHGREARRGVDGQVLHPGENVRFAYTAVTPQYLAILSLDAAARATIYYPETGADAARVAPGGDVLLPAVVTLAEMLGETSIVAVFCERPFELEPMRSALELEWSNLLAPAGCSTQELHVTQR